MILALSVLILMVTILYFISVPKYSELIKYLDKKEYILKNYLPIGLYIIDLSGYKFKTQYDKFLLTKITEIYGAKDGGLYLKIHWGNKILFFILSLIIVILIGTGADINRVYVVFSILFLTGTVLLHDKGLDKKIKKRRLSIQLDFPNFVNKLALMVNAGLTIRRSWEKISRENTKDSDFYKEVEYVILEIESGKPEVKAYEDFARRCRTGEVARFVTIILQNIRKGDSEMISILRILSSEGWEIRKNIAKRMGEEASTKMILPLTLIFISILIVLATPAILAISQM